MKQRIGLITIVVPDYDQAIAFYVGKLGFVLREDSYQPEQNKRWVVVAPRGSNETGLLLAKATTQEQINCVGNQTGGRVFLFLNTDNFERDYKKYQSNGVVFVRAPRNESYGIVCVFQDPFGNLWDLIQPSAATSESKDA